MRSHVVATKCGPISAYRTSNGGFSTSAASYEFGVDKGHGEPWLGKRSDS